jgi:ribosome-binding protein aMBF1 (putative translation factor)
VKTRKWAEVRGEKTTRQPGWEMGVKEARVALDNRVESFQATLAELRRARRMTQMQLAESLQTSQSEVSRIERQADMVLSTLREFIEGLGGELVLLARFPEEQWAEITIGDLLGSEVD